MSDLSFKRCNTLPATLEASSIYIVKAADGIHVDLVFTGDDAQVIRRTPTIADIDAKIAAAVAGLGGSGGSSSPSVIYTQPIRYEINSGIGYKAYCTTSAPVYLGINWTRTGTDLVVQHAAHGRAVGDRVIAKNVNVALLNSLITNVTADTYTVTCADTGSTSGSGANYTVGIKFAHNSEVAGALTGGVVSAPAGVDILIHSLRIRTKANSRAGATYDLTMPISLYSVSMGADTDTDGLYLPVHQIRGDADTLPAIANTIAVNQAGGGYHTIRFSALGATTQGQLMLLQF